MILFNHLELLSKALSAVVASTFSVVGGVALELVTL